MTYRNTYKIQMKIYKHKLKQYIMKNLETKNDY